MLCNSLPVGTKPQRILKPDGYKQRIQRMWEGRGSKYDSSDTFHKSLAEQLVKRASLQRGSTVLDVASGTGMVALPAAKLVGNNGKIIAVDISTSMLAEAQRKATETGLENIEFLVCDAETVEQAERTFDHIFCSSGMLYLQDIDRAIQQFHNWLKPGGQLHFNTPQEPCVPATTCFYDLVRDSLGICLADAAAPLGTCELVREVVERAGFSAIKVDTTDEMILYKDCNAGDYAQKIWSSLSANAIMTPLEGLVNSEQLQTLQDSYMSLVTAMAESWQTTDGVQNPYVMIWCSATKG